MRFTGKRLALTLVPLTAAGAVLSLTLVSGADASPATAADGKPCLGDATTLIGKVDGDAYPDRVSDPGHTGTKTTISWGKKDGSFSDPVSVNSLIGVKKGEVGAAAFADFHNAGRLDMLVSIVKPSKLDDPNAPRLAEFRLGPLNRGHLASTHTVKSDIGKEGEPQQLRIADYNGDPYPDVAIYHNSGDGTTERNVRLSTNPGGGLEPYDQKADTKYGDWGTPAEPPTMPTDGWSHFYTKCS